MKLLFKFNLKYVDIFIVQTHVMKLKLLRHHPCTDGKIKVIGQPVPNWIGIYSNTETHKKSKQCASLNLIYPANFYPHKNHKLLSCINTKKEWPVSNLILTIDESINPAQHVDWIKCVGFLPPSQLLDAYLESDALLFLSLEESLGFPLIEAMHLGLPIICPDLPYARIICGDHAIYFQANDLDSLRKSLIKLRNLLNDGWLPRWEAALSNLPVSWRDVANSFYLVSTH
jgi:glycosyltransferase involved in cell wall biosynthesis